MRLYLIRHPRPDVGRDICYGRSDVRADPQHCRELASSLATILPVGIFLISSPLWRCSELAHGIAQALRCDLPALDARLQEMDFGAWEMRRWEDIPRAEIDAWAEDTVHYRPGGGESVAAMAERVIDFLEEVRQRYEIGPALICHAGPIRLIQAYRPGMAAAEMAARAAANQGAIPFGQCMVWDLPT